MTSYNAKHLVNIGSGDDELPVKLQAITWTNVDLLSIIPYGAYFNATSFHVHSEDLGWVNAFKDVICKMLVIYFRFQCDVPSRWHHDLTLQTPVQYKYTVRTWSSLCLQMSQHLSVLGHQQAHWFWIPTMLFLNYRHKLCSPAADKHIICTYICSRTLRWIHRNQWLWHYYKMLNGTLTCIWSIFASMSCALIFSKLLAYK